MKRVVDLLVASTALVLATPLLLMTAVAIWATLGRPIFFTQLRPGRHGRPFRLIKFRSMRADRDVHGALLPDEQRLVPLGRFLRRFRLDELPGLSNVVRGDMSLVGPRPLLLDAYAADPAGRARRLSVRPGLTGWAQVNGNTLLDPAAKLALDLWYVDHRSLALDLVILWRTVVVLIRGERIDPGSLKRARIHANGVRGCS
jgi:lipopolysaccharide/colanic/teichoic acid biosynthesis glycosyltransferase